MLLNQCPHNLDLLQWICGMPSKVQDFCHIGKWPDVEIEDDVTAYLEFPDGAPGVSVSYTHLDVYKRQALCICGDSRQGN